MQSIRTVATALVLAVSGFAGADAQTPATTVTSPSPMAEGEVRRVDKDAGKVTIKHGPIKTDQLDMDPMTMVFEVRDKAMLEAVKAGDRIRFRVIGETGGRMTITEIKAVQ
jgi:Cu(I)/Ag(I) efflux system periplasmic protein CusF